MKAYSLEKLMSNTYPEPNTGCWLWAGLVDKDGYGRVSPKKYKIRGAHRLSYFFHKGDFDRSLYVLHKCDQPSCVNPDHLFLGTNLDNSNDRNIKGRTIHGIHHYKSKLDEIDIKTIRFLYSLGNYTLKDIAKLFCVTNVNIYLIVNRKIWK